MHRNLSFWVVLIKHVAIAGSWGQEDLEKLGSAYGYIRKNSRAPQREFGGLGEYDKFVLIEESSGSMTWINV